MCSASPESSRRDFQSFEDGIRLAWDQLPEAQRRAATYILKAPTSVAFSNVEDLAGAIGVSTASIIRLAQALGYDGFLALKQAVRDHVQTMMSPGDKVARSISDISALDEVLSAVIDSEITYLRLALKSISEEEFTRAVRRITSARRIGIIGLGVAESLVTLLTFRLRRFRLDAIPITRGGKNIYEGLHWLEAGDALVAFAFVRPWPELITSLEYARRVNVNPIVVTDVEASPVLKQGDIALVAERGPMEGYHSLVVPNAIVNAIILGCAKEAGGQAFKSLERFEEIRRSMKDIDPYI